MVWIVHFQKRIVGILLYRALPCPLAGGRTRHFGRWALVVSRFTCHSKFIYWSIHTISCKSIEIIQKLFLTSSFGLSPLLTRIRGPYLIYSISSVDRGSFSLSWVPSIRLIVKSWKDHLSTRSLGALRGVETPVGVSATTLRSSRARKISLTHRLRRSENRIVLWGLSKLGIQIETTNLTLDEVVAPFVPSPLFKSTDMWFDLWELF